MKRLRNREEETSEQGRDFGTGKSDSRIYILAAS